MSVSVPVNQELIKLADAIKAATSTCAPPPLLKVSEWADHHRVLSPESSAEPGQWMTERAEYQRGIMDAVNEPAVEDIVVIGNSQWGKCFRKGTKIILYSGEVCEVQNLVPGDTIMGDNSSPRIITSLAHGVGKMYKIIPNNNRANMFTVNGDHVLCLYNVNQKKYIEITVDALIKTYKSPGSMRLYQSPISFPEKNISIDPYFLGLWLGDGSSRDVKITNKDEEIIQYLKSYSKKLNMKLSVYSTRGKCEDYAIVNSDNESKKINKIREFLRNNNLIKNKHIPAEYLYNSESIRLSLLAGIVDSDGYLPKDKYCKSSKYEITLKNSRLVDDVVYLSRSLGFITSVVNKKIKGVVYKRIGIYGKIWNIPVLVERKKAKQKNIKIKSLHYGFKIKPLPAEEYFGFTLDGGKTFLLGDFTVAHNTECANNIIGYFIDQDPSPLMMTQPTLEMAQAWSKDRFAPMIRDTPALRGKVKDARSRNSENTILHKVFPGGNLTISGANSPATLAGRPKRIVIGDDIDRFPPSAGAEGDPVSLLFKRTTAFWNRKRILFSTPTNQHSRIWKAFQETDKRFYFVPCPKCGEFQTLRWKDRVSGREFVKWDKDPKTGKDLPETAYYECPHCGSHLGDADLAWMVRRGEWRATAPFNGKAGFSLNELYSPWVKLRETVQNFLEAKGDRELLKVWINTALGEIFEERGDAPEWERIYMRREKYEIGKIPAGGLLLVAGADVQKDRVEVEILAYGRGRQTWSIDYRVIMEDMTTPGAKAALDKLMQEQFPHELGGRAMIRVLAIDSGYATQDVYNWARRYPPNRVMAVKGSSTSSMILGLPKLVDVTVDGRKIERGARYWPVGVSVCKTELYGLLRLEKNPDGTFPDGYCHFPEYDEEFFKGMTAEELVMVGRRPEWKKTRERNEQLDCRNYGRAAASFCGIDRFIEETWKALENEMRAVPVQQAVPRHKAKKRSRVLSKGIQI